MATTTNYGWTTPDDTALVKDGASAIRTLGSSVDTTTKALNPETTLGDLAYRSSTANVKTRLGLGTAGQVLTVNSGASAPEWVTPSSGSLTLLSTTSLTGATTTISAIDQTYVHIFGIAAIVTNATGNGRFRIAPNNNTGLTSQACVVGTAVTNSTNSYMFLSHPSDDLGSGNNENVFTFTIRQYASTTNLKTCEVLFGYNDTGNNQRGGTNVGYIKTTSAISSLVFSNSAGNLSTGTVLLYGVK
jgi:hypothetical protein